MKKTTWFKPWFKPWLKPLGLNRANPAQKHIERVSNTQCLLKFRNIKNDIIKSHNFGSHISKCGKIKRLLKEHKISIKITDNIHYDLTKFIFFKINIK